MGRARTQPLYPQRHLEASGSQWLCTELEGSVPVPEGLMLLSDLSQLPSFVVFHYNSGSQPWLSCGNACLGNVKKS